MTLQEFRDKYPGFKANCLARSNHGNTDVECISWPWWDERGKVWILARVIGDFSTVKKYHLDGDNPELRVLEAVCGHCNKKTKPMLRFSPSDQAEIHCEHCSAVYQRCGGDDLSAQWHDIASGKRLHLFIKQ